VLLTTFSEILANALRTRLRRLISNEPRLAERLEVHALDAICERLYEVQSERPKIASRAVLRRLIESAASSVKFTSSFLLSEWETIVDAWQVESWEAYRDVNRLGRKTRLSESQRAAIWAVFANVRGGLRREGFVTRAEMYSKLAQDLAVRSRPPFDFIVVDEAQDVGVAQLRFLAALGGDRPNRLFFSGDLGQRIFQQPFSWKALGVDIRGRARTLHVNYRTSHQIRTQADRLLGAEIADVDGNTEERRGTVSVFNGPKPTVKTFKSVDAEIEGIASWLRERTEAGIPSHEIAVFVRSDAELERARLAAERVGLLFSILDDRAETTSGKAAIGTMHVAKGLEFRAVAVMACDDEVIPLQSRIESVTDDSDLEEVYNTERHLLYVACTRARDYLLVTSVEPASEFLDDLRSTNV
jgi:superfamily I DNA/RNA helicase